MGPARYSKVLIINNHKFAPGMRLFTTSTGAGAYMLYGTFENFVELHYLLLF